MNHDNEPPSLLAILLHIAAVGGILWAVNKTTKGKLRDADNTATESDWGDDEEEDQNKKKNRCPDCGVANPPRCCQCGRCGNCSPLYSGGFCPGCEAALDDD